MFLTKSSSMEKFYSTLPENLKKIIDQARAIETASTETSKMSIALIDATSLKDSDEPLIGAETKTEIEDLCQLAKIYNIHTAAVCVYQNHIETAKNALKGTDIKLAVVNNFPHGIFPAETAAADARKAIEAGADEIDTVIDYAALKLGNSTEVRRKLNEVSKVCKEKGAKLKIILKASTYESYNDLYQAAVIAIECGADFVKTCTGKKPLPGYGSGEPDASDLLTAATVMQAVADNVKKNIGVKISGGVKTPIDCEQMRFLSDKILGENYFKDKNLFRFGASSLLKNLIAHVSGNKVQTPKSAPNSY